MSPTLIAMLQRGRALDGWCTILAYFRHPKLRDHFCRTIPLKSPQQSRNWHSAMFIDFWEGAYRLSSAGMDIIVGCSAITTAHCRLCRRRVRTKWN
jgi:hypothetical protein